MKWRYAVLAALLMVTACDGRGSSDQTNSTTEPDAAPKIDADPTPDTGTGGTMQQADPDGTVNGAPAGNTKRALAG